MYVGHILHGKVRVAIWRVRVRVRVMWVTIWYLIMHIQAMGKTEYFHEIILLSTNITSLSVITDHLCFKGQIFR